MAQNQYSGINSFGRFVGVDIRMVSAGYLTTDLGVFVVSAAGPSIKTTKSKIAVVGFADLP